MKTFMIWDIETMSRDEAYAVQAEDFEAAAEAGIHELISEWEGIIPAYKLAVSDGQTVMQFEADIRFVPKVVNLRANGADRPTGFHPDHQTWLWGAMPEAV